MVHLSGAEGVALGESFAYSWRRPSPGGEAPVSPVSGGGAAQVVLTRTPPKLEIDSTQARREVGYVHMVELALDGREHALRQAGRGIADTVAAGARMAQAYNPENAVAALAFERMLIDLQDHQYRLAFVPRTPPEVTITPGTLTIDVVY